MSRRPLMEIAEDGTFRLAHQWRYNIPDTSDYVVLPEGMRTNFATIPAVVRWLISPIDPDIVIASVVHDWLVGEFPDSYMGQSPYIYRAYPSGSIIGSKPPWSESAGIMRWIMEAEGAAKWKRVVVYTGVRLYGVIKGKE